MRYFEDLPVGLAVELGTTTISEDEILEFGRRWDPQVFHTDPIAAKSSSFGGLVASGVHTLAAFIRLYVDGLLHDAASLGSPGLEQVRWLAPVRPGAELSGRYSVVSARGSASRPDRGVVHGVGELIDAEGTTVFRVDLINFFGRAPGERPDGQG